MPLTEEDVERDRPCKVDGCGDRRVQHRKTDGAALVRGETHTAQTVCGGCEQRYMLDPAQRGAHWHPDWFEMLSHSYVPDLTWDPDAV